MYKKIYSGLLLSFLLFFLNGFVQAVEQSVTNVNKVAEIYAKSFCDGVIDAGVPYYGPGKGDIMWVFTVYKKKDKFPSKESIKDLVAQARLKRLIAETNFEKCRQQSNQQGMREAAEKIKDAYAEMRNEANFATIYVGDYQNGRKIIAKILHHGLAPHYAAFLDAEQRAKNDLGVNSVIFERFLYLNPISIYGGFNSGTKTVYVNLNFLEKELINNMDLVQFSSNFYDSLGPEKTPQLNLNFSNQNKFSIRTPDTTWIPQITGVPDFYIGHESCALVSTTIILAYWEKKYQHQCGNYDAIIFNGDWNYEGFFYNYDGYNPPPYGEGWKGLAADEIAYKLSPIWHYDKQANPDDAMEAGEDIMNDIFRGRKYNFNANKEFELSISNIDNMYQSFIPFCNQVNTGKPFQYSYWGKIRYYMDGILYYKYQAHGMVGCGYVNQDSLDQTNNTAHWRGLVWGGGNHTPDVQWINDVLDCGAPVNIMLYSMTPGGMHWSGEMTSNTTWFNSDTIYVEADVTIMSGITLTIQDSTAINLNGKSVHVNGGNIVKGNNVTFNPDIRLLTSTTLKGQYSTVQSAMANATSSDQISICSNITVTGTLNLVCNVLVDSGASVTFENSTTTLNGKSIRVVNGTLLASNATFAPDIRLVCGANRKGQYPTVQSALADATSSDEVQIYTSSNLSGQLTVPCDLRVGPYRQLTIAAGSTLTFASGKKLIVQGILEAVGGSSTKVTLTSNGSWEGVWANGGDWGDASVDLTWTDIFHATYGLHLDYNTETELSHCRLQYNETGIYAYGGANVSVSGSSGIMNNEEEGIFGDFIDLYCSWSMIQYNGGDGCYLIDCEATIERMSFKNNADGIYYRNEGTLDMGASCSDKGNNKMYGTAGYKVALSNFATALANGNYWGIDGFSWDDIYIPGGCHFYENCPLSSPPLANSVANIAYLNKNSVVEAITGDPSSLIQYACQLRNDSLYAEAVAFLKPLVETTTLEPLWRVKALKELERNYNWAKWRKNGLEPAGKVTDYLDKVILENASEKAEACDALYRVALELKLKQNIREQHLEQAIQIGEELIQNNPNSFTEEHRLFDLFNLYLLIPAQSNRSEEYLAQLKTKYPKSRLIKHAENKLQAEQNYANSSPLIKDAQALNHETEILPDTYTLSPCFPNPFNSTTRIQYSLPEPARVALEVINQLGQTVLTLVEADQPAGRYEYNLQAEALSSGIYFIKLTANHFQQIQKVVLLR